jgi:serine/threonine protein kinase
MNKDKRVVLFYPAKKHKVRGWSVEEEIKLGSGITSTVYQVCRKKNCEFVMKVMHFEYHENIKREICIQKICAEYNLCKTIEDWWFLQGQGGVIIMPVLNKTLSSAMNMDKFKEKIKERDWEKFGEYLTEWFNDDENIISYITYIKKAFRLILALHQLGIYHGDSHSGNIMLDKDNNLFFIDFGFSGFSWNLINQEL